MTKLRLCALLWAVLSYFSLASTSRPDIDVEGHELLNKCLEGVNHKARPGPEDMLFKQCSPWTDRACCTEDTAQLIHFDGQKELYNFDVDHCKKIKPMSDKCKEHFVQDHCFFECSPNVGPWLVKVNMKTRNETFVDVPLCARDCERWFNDCKEDYTCTKNWKRNFDWRRVGDDSKKTNVCPHGSSCKTFNDIYESAQDFCEQVWDHSWKYTADELPCMTIWFDGSKGNPNDIVAREKVQAMINQDQDQTNDASSQQITLMILSISSITSFLNWHSN